MATQRSFFNAVKWAYTANWGEKALSAFFIFILAALLGPQNFGVVTIAMIYIGFIQMFLDQGLVAALIQRRDLRPEHLDAVFWMDLILSLGLVGLSIQFSHWWAGVNNVSELANVISVLSLCIPIEGLAIVQKALLQREMDFKSVSLRANASVLVGGGLGIGMAYAGYGVWALVGQQLAKDITALLLLWKLSTWRPRFEYSWKHLRELMSFSLSNFAAQLAMFTDMQTGAILLGALFGPVAVGLYRLADRLVGAVMAAATSSIQSVSFPEFSRLQGEPDELRKSVLTCIRLCSTVTLPAMAGLAVVSDPLMATIGSQWAPASDVLKILSVLCMIIMFAFFTGPLLQAVSRPHHLAALEWTRTVVGLVFLGVAAAFVRHATTRSQIMAIALARFATGAFLVTPVFLYILIRLSRISFRDLAASVAPSVAAAATVVGSVALFHLLGSGTNGRPAIVLMEDVGIGGISGMTTLLSLDAQPRLAIMAMVQRMLGHTAVSKELV